MKTILIFFGPPGSGKGTQADMLALKLRLPVISPGELLRYEVNTKTKIGKEVKERLANGKMVPDEIVNKIIDKRLAEKDTKRGFVLDGYPRRKQQLEVLKKKLEKITNEEDNIYAVLINVKDSEVKKRLGGRRVSDCGASYHIKFNPPKKKGICDICDKRLYIREDDRPKVIVNRLASYKKRINFLFNYWNSEKKLIIIDGNQSIKKVEKDILREMKKKKIL